MTLKKKLTELLGEEELANKVLESGLLVPQEKYLEETRTLKTKLSETETSFTEQLLAKDNELYSVKTAQMTEEQKLKADNERLQSQISSFHKEKNILEGKNKLIKAGFNDEEEINKLTSTLITEDSTKSMESIDMIVNLRKGLEQGLKSQVEKDILDSNQKDEKGGESTPPKVVKDDDENAFAQAMKEVLEN